MKLFKLEQKLKQGGPFCIRGLCCLVLHWAIGSHGRLRTRQRPCRSPSLLKHRLRGRNTLNLLREIGQDMTEGLNKWPFALACGIGRGPPGPCPTDALGCQGRQFFRSLMKYPTVRRPKGQYIYSFGLPKASTPGSWFSACARADTVRGLGSQQRGPGGISKVVLVLCPHIDWAVYASLKDEANKKLVLHCHLHCRGGLPRRGSRQALLARRASISLMKSPFKPSPSVQGTNQAELLC